MTDYIDYFPHKIESGMRYDVLAIHFCVDFGGRQSEVEFQIFCDGKKVGEISVSYYYLTNEWGKSSWSVDDKLTEWLRNGWIIFDTTKEAQND
jgi:hypothetical protein